MVIKSLSRKSEAGTAQLIKYVLREHTDRQSIKLSQNDLAQIAKEFHDGKLKLSFFRDYVTTRSKVIEAALSNARLLAKTHVLAKAIAEREAIHSLKSEKVKFFINHEHIIVRRSGMDTLYSINSPRLKAHKREERLNTKESLVQLVLKHNISSQTTKGYIEAFARNEANRLHRRSDAVRLRHTVISLGKEDKDKVRDEMMKDIAKKFVELNGKESLYLGVIHRDRENIHLHIVQSGTKISGISNRLSREEFQNVKIKLQEYQQQKYPELIHSLPDYSRLRSKTAPERDYQNIKRNERYVSNKLELQRVLEATYSNSRSIKDFVARIETEGYSVYFRNDRVQGVKIDDGAKFRFSRLGLTQERIIALDSIEEKEIAHLRDLNASRESSGRTLSRAVEVEDDKTEEKDMDEVEVDEAGSNGEDNAEDSGDEEDVEALDADDENKEAEVEMDDEFSSSHTE